MPAVVSPFPYGLALVSGLTAGAAVGAIPFAATRWLGRSPRTATTHLTVLIGTLVGVVGSIWQMFALQQWLTGDVHGRLPASEAGFVIGAITFAVVGARTACAQRRRARAQQRTRP